MERVIPALSTLLHVLVHHGAYTTVRPYVLSRLYHINDGIDRQDDAHDADRSVHARHQGEGQEVATHWDTGIAHCRQDGDEKPKCHGWQ